MLKARRRELHKITQLFTSDKITLDQWFDQMTAVLLEGHTKASYFGRMLAAQEELAGELVDVLHAQAAVDGEDYYLRGFAEAIYNKDPRYWDAEAEKWKAAAIEDRQDLYLPKMRGTANDAFLRESEPFTMDWLFGLTEKHCIDCLDMNAGNPWKPSEMPTAPGKHELICKLGCDCYLRRSDGVQGFLRVDF